MLQCIPNKRRNVVKAWREKDALCLKLENGLQRIVPVNSGIVRVLFTEKESFSDQEKPGIIELPTFGDWSYQVTGEAFVLEMKHLKV